MNVRERGAPPTSDAGAGAGDASLSVGRRRSRAGPRLLIALAFSLAALAQAWWHLGATASGRPYETWDEIATFSTAYVVNTPAAEARAYRYGSADTFLQWLGIAAYEYLDPLGPTTGHIRYGNIAPASWEDPYLAFKPKTWAGADYNYFRGVDDRQPIYLSRIIHLGFAYALVLAIGYILIAAYGARSLFLLAPLLLLTVGPEEYFQLAQSLPNGVNGVLAFAVVVFAMMFVDQRRPAWLALSTAAYALGLNFKFDLIIFAAAPAGALILVTADRDYRLAVRSALMAAATSGLVYLASRPLFLKAPLQQLRLQYHTILDSGGGRAEGYIPHNLDLLAGYLGSSLVSAGVLPLLGAAVAALLLAVAVLGPWRRPPRRWTLPAPRTLIPLIGAAMALAAWVAVVTKGAGIAERYLLNGMGAYLAAVGMGLLLTWRQPSRARFLAPAFLAAVVLSYGGNAIARSIESARIQRANAALGGFDPAHNRNRAAAFAADLVRSGRYPRTVLVDQHSYADLRPLRLRGAEPRYVNMLNLDRELRGLAARPYLVIFSTGTTDKTKGNHRPWMGEWSGAVERCYAAYRARLGQATTLRRFEGAPQLVTSTAPVNARDEIYVGLLPAAGAPPAADPDCQQVGRLAGAASR